MTVNNGSQAYAPDIAVCIVKEKSAQQLIANVCPLLLSRAPIDNHFRPRATILTHRHHHVAVALILAPVLPHNLQLCCKTQLLRCSTTLTAPRHIFSSANAIALDAVGSGRQKVGGAIESKTPPLNIKVAQPYDKDHPGQFGAL